MSEGLMFPSYDPAARDAYGFAPLASRAWLLLWQAIAAAPSGNVEQTVRGVTVFGKLKEISEPGDGGRRLCQAGAMLSLTSEERDYARHMLERIRDQVPIAQGDALIYLDGLLAAP